MKLLRFLALFAVLISSAQAMQKPAAHTEGSPTGKPTGPLKPGEYGWKPRLSASNIAGSYATVYPLTTLPRILSAQLLAIVLFR